jgi:hypothetical protein
MDCRAVFPSWRLSAQVLDARLDLCGDIGPDGFDGEAAFVVDLVEGVEEGLEIFA